MSDLSLHTTVSATLALSFTLILRTQVDLQAALLWGAAAAFGVGILKEVVHDHLLGWGTPEWKDIGANAVGVGPFILLALMVE